MFGGMVSDKRGIPTGFASQKWNKEEAFAHCRLIDNLYYPHFSNRRNGGILLLSFLPRNYKPVQELLFFQCIIGEGI